MTTAISRTVLRRQAIERRIARSIIRDAIAEGYSVSVDDGDEVTLRCSREERAIIKALMSTDEDRLLMHRPGQTVVCGWVYLVYGNDGYDVVNDYTTNMEAIMVSANALADRLEGVRWIR